MKCLIAILLLTIFAIAMAEKAAEVKNTGAPKQPEKPDDRGKRGLFLGTYTSPFGYYGEPIAYSSYNYPHAYYPNYRYHYNYPYYYNYPYIY